MKKRNKAQANIIFITVSILFVIAIFILFYNIIYFTVTQESKQVDIIPFTIGAEIEPISLDQPPGYFTVPIKRKMGGDDISIKGVKISITDSYENNYIHEEIFEPQETLDIGETINIEIPYTQSTGTITPPIQEIAVAYIYEKDGEQKITHFLDIEEPNIKIESFGETPEETTMQITECGELSTAGIYTLQNDITNYGSGCFNVLANGITLDFNGHFILGDSFMVGYNTPDDEKGVYINGYDNIKILNANISNFTYGVYAENTNNLNISGGIYSDNGAKDWGMDASDIPPAIIADTIFQTASIQIKDSSNFYVSDVFLEYEDYEDNTEWRSQFNPFAGIYLIGSSNGIIKNITSISNGGKGIILESSSNNQISLANLDKWSYGLLLQYNSDHNTIRDSVITNSFNNEHDLGDAKDIYVSESIDNNCINCSYDISKELVRTIGWAIQDPSELKRKWYYQVQIKNGNSPYNPMEGAEVKILNSSDDLQFSSLTNSSGLIEIKEVIEYVNYEGTRNYYGPHTIDVSKDYYVQLSSESYDISSELNSLDNIIEIFVCDPSDCDPLIDPNCCEP